jgi:hypothetical protein
VPWTQVYAPYHLPRVDKERLTIELCENFLVRFSGNNNKPEFYDFLNNYFSTNFQPFDCRNIVNKMSNKDKSKDKNNSLMMSTMS